MPRHNADDNIMMRPPPSTRVPWLVILFLIACLVLVYLGFLRPQDKLLGPPLPENSYLQYVKPKKRAMPAPAAAAAPNPTAHAPGAAGTPAAPAVPVTGPVTPETPND